MGKLICKLCGREDVTRSKQCVCGNIVDTEFIDAPESVEELKVPHEEVTLNMDGSGDSVPLKEVISQPPSEDEKVVIEEKLIGEKTFYRVRVGPFSTEGIAKNTMITMKNRLNLKDPFVIKKDS